MKCLWSLPVLCATTVHPVNRHFTSCNNLGKDTTYVVGPPPTSLTPLVGGAQMPQIRAMCVLRYEAVTITPYSLQFTRVSFCYLKVSASPIARRLYAVSRQFPQMNLGVHTIALFFIEVSLQTHPIEHSYRHCQCTL